MGRVKAAFPMASMAALLIAVMVFGVMAGSISVMAEDIPQGATIDSAVFSIYVSEPSGETVYVHRITAGWDESTVTWNSFGGSYAEVVGSFVADSVGWRSVDLTALVRDWADGDYENYGVLLAQGAGYTAFLSSEWGTVLERPKLEIAYTSSSGSGTLLIQRPGAEQDGVADAYINEQYPDNNVGSAVRLYSGLVNDYSKQALVRFDFTYTPFEYGGGTPGYWRNHLEAWVGYSPDDIFSDVFGVGPSITLYEAIWMKGGGEKALIRHATAAILNASSPDVMYPMTEAEIVAAVQAAYVSGNFNDLKNQLDEYNNLGIDD
jgi:hypothetical protein